MRRLLVLWTLSEIFASGLKATLVFSYEILHIVMSCRKCYLAQKKHSVTYWISINSTTCVLYCLKCCTCCKFYKVEAKIRNWPQEIYLLSPMQSCRSLQSLSNSACQGRSLRRRVKNTPLRSDLWTAHIMFALFLNKLVVVSYTNYGCPWVILCTSTAIYWVYWKILCNTFVF